MGRFGYPAAHRQAAIKQLARSFIHKGLIIKMAGYSRHVSIATRAVSNTRLRVPAEIKRLSLTTVAFASSGATTLIFNLVLVRVLSVSAFGTVARTFALGMAVAQMTMAGVSPAIGRRVAHARSDDQRFSQARGGVRALLISCGIVSLLYFPLAFAGLGPTTALSLVLGWSLALVYATYFGLKFLLFMLDWAARYARLEFISDAIFFVALILLATLAPTAGVLTFSIAYSVFVLMATHLISQRGHSSQAISLDRSLLKYAGWASLATYASVGRFTAVVVITGAMVGSAAAGELTAVLAIIMPFFLIPQAAAVLTFADVARAKGSATSMRVRAICKAVGWLSAFAIITCCLFAPEIVRVLLGSRYGTTTKEFVILIICMAPQIVALPIGNALAAMGAVALTAGLSIAAFIALLLGLALLAPAFGALGAAIAFGLSMLIGGLSAIIVGSIRFELGLWEVAGTAVSMALGVVAFASSGSPLVVRIAAEVLLLSIAGAGLLLVKQRSQTGHL